jgi:hypothetical protein
MTREKGRNWRKRRQMKQERYKGNAKRRNTEGKYEEERRKEGKLKENEREI